MKGKQKLERDVKGEIMRAIGARPNVRVFNNVVGLFERKGGGKVRTGLAPGSSDLIGWLGVTVTPEMVGSTVAVFLAIETKSARGSESEAQAAFLRTVATHGGIALIGRDAQNVIAAIEGDVARRILAQRLAIGLRDKDGD